MMVNDVNRSGSILNFFHLRYVSFSKSMESNILGPLLVTHHLEFFYPTIESPHRILPVIVNSREYSIEVSFLRLDIVSTDKREFPFLTNITTSSHPGDKQGYRIHAAIFKGKVRTVKIYEGMDSREVQSSGGLQSLLLSSLTSRQRLLEDMNLNRSLSYSTILHTVAGCKTAPRPFAILDTGIRHSSSADLGSLKTLSCYLVHSLTGCQKDCLLAGAKLFDLMVDSANAIFYKRQHRKMHFGQEDAQILWAAMSGSFKGSAQRNSAQQTPNATVLFLAIMCPIDAPDAGSDYGDTGDSKCPHFTLYTIGERKMSNPAALVSQMNLLIMSETPKPLGLAMFLAQPKGSMAGIS
ncbi:hypothetical protein C8J56DRAFT_883333 [Mycena floridula]|nr:hypothetical protein C8J56DRAFT_883333 [Mycena floridula]